MKNFQTQSKTVKKIQPARVISGIPSHYFQNQSLKIAKNILPKNYNFQIEKTLYRIDCIAKQLNIEEIKVSLQFPEGLMIFACIISDILTTFSKAKVIILGDLTYGACCVDDLASEQIGCQLLVHYGHSCLIPITQTRKKILYIFVEIQIDLEHFIQTIEYNFEEFKKNEIYLMGTIQFNSSLFIAKQMLSQLGFNNIIIPQEKPRSGGQILGCTSPKLPLHPKNQPNIILFLCDGRFHMEAAMIANPQYKFYQYDPYTRNITHQKYATTLMIQRRTQEITKARNGSTNKVCFILGTLGRQGSTAILNRLIMKVQGIFQYMVLLASQINIQLLQLIEVDFYVQIACPRLSIDWAYGTPKPLLTPYELFAMLDKIKLQQNYPMDYYSHNGGAWSNFYGKVPQKGKKNKPVKASKISLQIQKDQNCRNQTVQCCKK